MVLSSAALQSRQLSACKHLPKYYIKISTTKSIAKYTDFLGKTCSTIWNIYCKCTAQIW